MSNHCLLWVRGRLRFVLWTDHKNVNTNLKMGVVTPDCRCGGELLIQIHFLLHCIYLHACQG